MTINSEEMDSDGQSKNITKEQQDKLLTQAKQAAISGDPRKMLEYLYLSRALDGLTRQIASKWRSLSCDEIHDILAEAVDILYVAIRDRKKVNNLVAYLFKTFDYKACNYYRARQNQIPLSPDELEQIPDKSTEVEKNFDNSTKELGWENKKPQAIAIARSLLPKLGQYNIQNVMAYIFDALEADCMDISNAEIAEALGLSIDVVRKSKSRGFYRLKRIVRDEELDPQVSHFVNLERDLEEQIEDEYELV
ncbi:hypothetical protein NIES4101_47460 [Calothrix sp. NIES-4101]|nr:hypothetical protein NIES4101_47460 [Calothrix sp. NIES-4101]